MTTGSIAEGPALPGWPFHGLVVAPFESGTIMFLPVGGGDSIEVVLTAGDLGCGLDLDADRRLVEVGLNYYGGGPQVERFVWGEAGSAVIDRTLSGDEGDLVQEAAGTTIMIERKPTSTAIEVSTESGVLAKTEVVSDRLTVAQLHGFDGRSLLVRLGPEEPACDRGVVYAINLSSGGVACTDGRTIAVQLVGQADPPPQPTAPTQLEPATDDCETGTMADLLEVITS